MTFWPGSLPRAEEVQLDWHVLLFAIAASLLSGLLFGLAPALRAPARELEQALRAGGRTLAGSSRRLHSSFVISEIGLAVVLLVAAGLLGRTLLQLSSLDPGVNTQNVLTARMALSPATLANPAQTRLAWQDVLDRIRRVPGVQAVATVDTVPMREGSSPIGYATTAAAASDDKQPLVLANSVSPDYLKVMGIRQLEGRFFDDQDRIGSESVVVIDDVMAREAFPGQQAIGKHLWIDLGADPARVVGVVRHVRYWGLASDDKAKVRAQLYYPFAQVPDRLLRRWSELMLLEVIGAAAPADLYGQLPAEGPEHFWGLVRRNDELEKSVREKAAVTDILKRAFQSVNRSLTEADDDALDQARHFFGEQTTVRRVYLRLLTHAHEHMGQMIAYMRMNGMSAPWPDWRPDRQPPQ